MTWDAEIEKPNPRAEFILCIEGIGWPTDETDLSQGFDGTIYSTNDINGDLKTQLGCDTVITNLLVPSSIRGDQLDPVGYKYEHDGVGFTLVETEDDDILTTIKPKWANGQEGTLNADLDYSDTEPSIDNSGNTWSTGDVIWVAGREAIKLGTRTLDSGSVYTYPSSTRGYLGTPRGRLDRRPRVAGAFRWESGTAIHDFNQYWGNRRVWLMAHVPGESSGNVQRLYPGRITNIEISEDYTEWGLTTVFDRLGPIASRTYTPPTGLQVGLNRFEGEIFGVTEAEAKQSRRFIEILSFNDTMPPATQVHAYYSLALSYDYRNRIDGGTVGAVNQAGTIGNDPQARQNNAQYLNWSMLNIGGHLLRAIRSGPFGLHQVVTQGVNFQTNSGILSNDPQASQVFPEGTPVALTLDNRIDSAKRSWFGVGDSDSPSVRRHPMDVLLMFLLSMNNEFELFDADATATTTSIVRNSGSFVVDEWNGYAVFAVQDSNKGQARTITDTTTSKVDVGVAFGASPTASNEYQIRNSVYDVLPFGWGFGVHHRQVNVSGAESIRDTYMQGAELGKFVLSPKESIDLWDVIEENICQPFGILVYLNRSTGKLDFLYLGETTPQDGLLETYTSVGESDILRSGKIGYMPRLPLGSLELEIRGSTKQIKPVMSDAYDALGGGYLGKKTLRYEQTTDGNSPTTDGATRSIQLNDSDLQASFDPSQLNSRSIKALFNDKDSLDFLIAQGRARFLRTSVPPPVISGLRLDLEHYGLQAGEKIDVTAQTKLNLPDPYLTNRGWSSRTIRILGTRLLLDEDNPGIEIEGEILQDAAAGLVAPAANISSKASDGNGDYFVITISDFSNGDAEDWDEFATNDYIELRDKNGVVQEDHQITGFGANEDADPDDADPADPRIYVAGTISRTIVSGDYITLRSWDEAAANTTNMDRFAALADASGTLGGNSDDGKTYV